MYSSAQLMGGLGNQMFQLAHAYAQTWKAQAAGVDVSAVFELHVAHIEQFPERQASKYTSNILQNINFVENYPIGWANLHEAGFSYREIAPSWDRSIKFYGYFQSEKYFKDYRNNIVDLFGAPANTKQELLAEFPQLKANTTALFVRRGDYLKYPEIHPPTTLEYIVDALEINRATNPEHYLVVSDDYAWCDDVLPRLIPRGKITNVVGADWKQLWLASLCSNFICTNSTFGWWSAYLSDNLDKQIIFPARWFGSSGPQNWQDIYIENSIII